MKPALVLDPESHCRPCGRELLVQKQERLERLENECGPARPDLARSEVDPRPIHAPSSVEARFERILADYGRWLRATVARICPVRLGVQPEDIEQEVRLRLWRTLQRETEITHLPSYLYRVASTAMLDVLDQAGLKREQPQDWSAPEADVAEAMFHGPAPSAECQAARRQILERVRDILRGYTQDRAQAVGLRLQGFTVPEIAGLTGWTEDRIRNLVHRGMTELRERLRAEGIEDAAG